MGYMYLADLSELSRSSRENGCVHGFEQNSLISRLRWPADVVEQFLFDHGDNSSFVEDYGSVELERIEWQVEVVPLELFLTMPTGPSDGDCIETYALNPGHWVEVRSHGIHSGVRESWDVHGTWKRWPILIARQALSFNECGLQVIEGRTRVGVLRGRQHNGEYAAPNHLAWVERIRRGGTA
jgi:hypothetical protein